MKTEIADNLKHHFENKEGVCSDCIKLGIQQEKKRIIEISKKIKIRRTISYPTMLNHYYVSQRDFEEFIKQIDSQETGLDMGSSKELRYTTNQSPDTRKGNVFCKCGHRKYGHNLKEDGKYNSCHIDYCKCKKFQEEKQ